jgi:hypothetical protein
MAKSTALPAYEGGKQDRKLGQERDTSKTVLHNSRKCCILIRFSIAERARTHTRLYSYSIKRPKFNTSDFRERKLKQLISTINLSRAKKEKTDGTSKNS